MTFFIGLVEKQDAGEPLLWCAGFGLYKGHIGKGDEISGLLRML